MKPLTESPLTLYWEVTTTQKRQRTPTMISDFSEFCMWMYVLVDDIWQQIAPLFDRPSPEPVCSDSELISMALIGECRGWDLEMEMLSQ